MNRQYGALSGIAILLIVLNHAIHFGLQVSPVQGVWLNALIVLQAVGAFAVPAFLFISGAFLSYAAKALSLEFIRGNFERIVWPYLIWSVIFYVLVFLTNGERYSAFGYVRNVLIGYPYHFVPLLLFWYLAAPIVVKFGKHHGATLLAAVGMYQGLLLAMRFPDAFGLSVLPGWVGVLKPPVLFEPMSDWAVYFPLGLVISMHGASLKPLLFRWRWLAVAAGATLFALGILNAYAIVPAPWARFIAPLPVMFLLPVISRSTIPLVDRLEALGKRSYGIYLTHFVVINFLVFLVSNLNLGFNRLPAVVFPAFLIATLGLSLALMDLLTKPVPFRRAYRYVFGIVPPGPPLRRRFA